MSEQSWVSYADRCDFRIVRGLGGTAVMAARVKMSRGFQRGVVAALFALAMSAMMMSMTGCATQGDLLRVEEDVASLKRSGSSGADPFKRIALLSSDIDVLRQEVRALQGELELARKEAADALAEVRKTRTAVAQGAMGGAAIDSGVPAAGRAGGSPDQEVGTYQKALETWQADDFKGCIDQFTGFLQVYPSSSYADDAAYWLADCTYSNKEYKRAILRFNNVVSVYPDSPKAPDALYRQGESLLKLGPNFKDAARTVFKRVEKEYPNSPRAAEAKRQLDSLGAGPA